jgi:hypothetical protein
LRRLRDLRQARMTGDGAAPLFLPGLSFDMNYDSFALTFLS